MRWRATLVLSCLLSLPGAAAAQTSPLDRPPQNYGGYELPQSPRRSTTPRPDDGASLQWLVRPTALPFTLFFPRAAQEQGVVGLVVLDCEVRADQRLDCDAARETPEGWGFGAAALAMSRSFRARPGMRNGRVIGHPRVRMPINFRSAIDEAPLDPDALDLPAWEAAPNADAVRAAWPEGRTHSEARGRAVLNCTVNEDRSINCSLLRESQEGLGFGHAALALSSQFRVSQFAVAFIERHRATPFLLPVNFGFGAIYEPLNRFTAGDRPIQFEEPPPMVVGVIYPPAARNAHVSGVAVVTCTIRVIGPAECAVTSETPEGQDFGAAALTLANAAMATVPFEESLPGDQVAFRVPFDLTALPTAGPDAAH